MKLFLSPKFSDQMNRLPKQTADRIGMLLVDLHQMPSEQVLSDSRAKHLATHGDLLMFNVENLRIFADKAEKDNEPVLLFLDIQQKRGTPRYLHLLDGEALKWEVDSIIANTNASILGDDTVNSEIASTNACGWWLDDYEVESIDKNPDGTITVEMTFHLSGDHDDDRMYSGTEITGKATATIAEDGDVSYEVTEAEKD